MNLSVGISGSLIDSPSGALDGIGHYTEQLLTELVKVQVKTLCYSFQPLRRKVQFKRSVSLDRSYETLAGLGLLTRGKLFACHPPVDIYHSTDFKIVPMKCPVIATIWDAIPYAHPEWVASSWRGYIIRQLVKRAACFADHVIASSQHAALDIIQYFGIDERKISLIPCAIDDRWYADVDPRQTSLALKKYGLSGGGYFLSVGTLQPRKNFDRLIDAYLSLPLSIRQERKLVIVGRYGWHCQALVERLQSLAPEVIWLSDVSSDDDLRHIYAGADVFVFPSLYEGFGLPVVEAFACGVPVISSYATSLPEISQGAAIEINPYSYSEMAEAMQLLATSPAEREKRVRLGAQRAAKYRWDQTLPQLLELYKKVISR